MDRIRIKLVVTGSGNRAGTRQGRAWTRMAYKLTDLWDSGNYT